MQDKDSFLDDSFESIQRLKQEMKEDNEELKTILNKKRFDLFELDSFMNAR